MKPRPSLKARGIQLLAQREHSRSELRAKLLRHARADLLLQQAVAPGASQVSHDPHGACGTRGEPLSPRPHPDAATDLAATVDPETAVDPEAAVDTTLDWLQAHRYLDESRFIESRVHTRAGRYGNLRIRQELAQHGAVLSEDTAAALKASEFTRARDVWSRRFGEPPADAAARAKQMRFLAGRGFSPEVIRRVVRAAGGVDDDE